MSSFEKYLRQDRKAGTIGQMGVGILIPPRHLVEAFASSSGTEF